jgi:uncharacterized protein YqeY
VHAGDLRHRLCGALRAASGRVTVLRDDINNALKEAMKAKDERRVSTHASGQFHFPETPISRRAAPAKTLSEADLLPVLQKMIKQRQESKELYEKGGTSRTRAAGSRRDRDHFRLSAEADVRRPKCRLAIDAAITETGAASMKDMGKVVGALKAKFAGQMDFAKASGLVKGKARRLTLIRRGCRGDVASTDSFWPFRA